MTASEPAFAAATVGDWQIGMSTRTWLAGHAMAGLLHGSGYGAELHRIFDPDSRISDAGHSRESPQTYTARIAMSLADALIEQLAARDAKEAKQ